MQFINLRWEDGRASCAPLLDGLSWDKLGPRLDLEPVGPEHSDARSARRSNRAGVKVEWADMADAHDDEAQWSGVD
eukprot:15271120-Alexandrium_andersonii.AAC.1